jgi:hypothetical protein
LLQRLFAEQSRRRRSMIDSIAMNGTVMAIPIIFA